VKAAFLTEPGTIEMRDISVPVPEDDQVLVKVEAVGVCGSDVHFYAHGNIGTMIMSEPFVLGHELSGVITAVGSKVDASRVGKRVAIEPQRPCRTCNECRHGRYNLCPNIIFYAVPHVNGAFTEFVTIQNDFAFDLPDNVSFEAGALLEPLSVAIWSCQRAQISVGSRVLIAGAGPIGVIMAQTAKAFGASEVIITDMVEARRDFALLHGATRAIDPSKESVHGLDVDAFIDATGVSRAVYDGIKAIGPNGRAILVGMGDDDVLLPVDYIQAREIWVTGIFRYTNTWPTAIELVSTGKVNLDALVTHRFSLDQVEEALLAPKLPGAMKPVVLPNS
jgi:L-iditol 2-dehydrogenase